MSCSTPPKCLRVQELPGCAYGQRFPDGSRKHCLVALTLNFVVQGFACGAGVFLECNETKAALLPDLVRGVTLSVFVSSVGSAMWPDR